MLGQLVRRRSLRIHVDLKQDEFGRIVVVLEEIKADVPGLFAGAFVIVGADRAECVDAVGLNVDEYDGCEHKWIPVLSFVKTARRRSVVGLFLRDPTDSL